MSPRRLLALLPLLAALPVISPGCASESEYPGDGREPVGSRSEDLDKAARMTRYAKIRDAAKTRGVPKHGFLLAGIAEDETNLAQCWSEATWACKGPTSPDCNGPVIAGASDGPCSEQQGGLGMFQFDAGTYAQTIAKYGSDVLTIAGNVSHAIDYVVNMVKESAYTTNAETNAKALVWINNFDINNGTLRDEWIKTVVRYYNGCPPGASCYASRYKTYNDALSYVINDTGIPFWDTTPKTPPDKAPKGSLDTASCADVTGWSQDPDVPTKAIAVHIYLNGDSKTGHLAAVTAGENRADLCKAIGSCNHGFTLESPYSLFDGKAHDVYAYGIDSNGPSNGLLTGSPKKLDCPLKIPAGVTRWVTNPTSLKAWKFDTYFDEIPAAKADVDKITDGPSLPATPALVQVTGEAAVWLVDGDYKHHVPNPDVMAAWRFAAADVKKETKAAVDKLVTAPDVRARPTLVTDSKGRLLLIDDALPTEGDGGAGGAAGEGGAAGSPAGNGGEGGEEAGKGGSAGAHVGGAAGASAHGGNGGESGGAEHGGAAGAHRGGSSGGDDEEPSGPIALGGSSESGGCATREDGSTGADAAFLLGLALVLGRRRR